jgi:hypothetical protein
MIQLYPGHIMQRIAAANRAARRRKIINKVVTSIIELATITAIFWLLLSI